MWNTPKEKWITFAVGQFEGPAARWLESAQRHMPRANWEEFCTLLQARFGRNQH